MNRMVTSFALSPSESSALLLAEGSSSKTSSLGHKKHDRRQEEEEEELARDKPDTGSSSTAVAAAAASAIGLHDPESWGGEVGWRTVLAVDAYARYYEGGAGALAVPPLPVKTMAVSFRFDWFRFTNLSEIYQDRLRAAAEGIGILTLCVLDCVQDRYEEGLRRVGVAAVVVDAMARLVLRANWDEADRPGSENAKDGIIVAGHVPLGPLEEQEEQAWQDEEEEEDDDDDPRPILLWELAASGRWEASGLAAALRGRADGTAANACEDGGL